VIQAVTPAIVRALTAATRWAAGLAPGWTVVRSRGVGLLGFSFWYCLASFSLGCSPAPSRPGRIILVSMDTVRSDRITRDVKTSTMPTLAAIASEGVWLENFYAASSYTLPSHMSIFSGLDAAEHGMSRDEAELNPSVTTLAQALADAGYRGVGLHEGANVAARFGFARGFESYRELRRLDVVGRALPALLEWLHEAGDEPYFLFLHTYAAHFPYGGFERYRAEVPERGLPSDQQIARLREEYASAHSRRKEGRADAEIPAETRRLCTLYNQLSERHGQLLGCGDYYLPADFAASRHGASDLRALLASYDERIRQIDRVLLALRDTLVELGQWDDTLLVVTADHGEAFLEHASSQHDYIPFNEVFKVPAVISYPALLRDAPVHELQGLTWQLDLMPTILGLAGARIPPGARGTDLSAILEGRETLPRDRAIFPAVLRLAHREARPLRRLVVRGDLKFIEGDAHFGDEEGLLFDLKRDPGERHNLREERPDAFRELAALAHSYAAGLDPRPPIHQTTGRLLPMDPLRSVPVVDLSQGQAAALRELGYLNTEPSSGPGARGGAGERD